MSGLSESIPASILIAHSNGYLLFLSNILSNYNEGCSFLDELKLAEIVPIYKKDNPLNKENYRPVNLLPHVSEIFENTIIHSRYNSCNLSLNLHCGYYLSVVNDLCYNIISVFPREVESVFFEILLPNSKPTIIGIIYHPPNQSNFWEQLIENLNKIDSISKQIYILLDFNISLLLNDSSIFSKKKVK